MGIEDQGQVVGQAAGQPAPVSCSRKQRRCSGDWIVPLGSNGIRDEQVPAPEAETQP